MRLVRTLVVLGLVVLVGTGERSTAGEGLHRLTGEFCENALDRFRMFHGIDSGLPEYLRLIRLFRRMAKSTVRIVPVKDSSKYDPASGVLVGTDGRLLTTPRREWIQAGLPKKDLQVLVSHHTGTLTYDLVQTRTSWTILSDQKVVQARVPMLPGKKHLEVQQEPVQVGDQVVAMGFPIQSKRDRVPDPEQVVESNTRILELPVNGATLGVLLVETPASTLQIETWGPWLSYALRNRELDARSREHLKKPRAYHSVTFGEGILVASFGTVLGIGREIIATDLDGSFGMGGGPVVNLATGKLIGVIDGFPRITVEHDPDTYPGATYLRPVGPFSLAPFEGGLSEGDHEPTERPH